MAPIRRSLLTCLLILALTSLPHWPAASRAATDWNSGDVFVGLGGSEGFLAIADDPATPDVIETADDPSTPADEMVAFNLLGKYRVLSPDGTFREELASSLAGVTTGCAIDPITGDLFGTNFADVTVERIDGTHDGASGHIATSFPVWNQAATTPGAASIESIVFDRAGNYYVGVPDDTSDHLSARSYDGFGMLFKFTPLGTKLAEYRVPVNTYPTGYRPTSADPAPRGVDWIDLAADGNTVFYTSEDRFIRTFVLDADPRRAGDQPGPGPGNALTIDGVAYPATPGIWGYVVDAKLFAIRLLPPGNGRGGLIVAGPGGLHRVDARGAALALFTAPETGRFFAINFSPDAQYAWTATQESQSALLVHPERAAVFKFHVATGRGVKFGTDDRLPMPVAINGLCVKSEYTAQSVDCAADPDNALCRQIEFCSTASPGDDDEDGLSDAQDPDCVSAEPLVNAPPVLVVPDRHVNEGDVLDFIVPAATDPDGDPVSVCVLGHRPDGITYEVLPDNSVRYFGTVGDVQGINAVYSVCHVTDGQAQISVTMRWIIRDLDNQPPACSAAAATPANIWPPNHALVPVTIAGVSDPDGDRVGITITSIEQNEPTDSNGDGTTIVDGVIEGGSKAFVRAERAGTRQSRVYRIGYSASDGQASCSGFAYAVVGHDRADTAMPPATPWHNSLVAPAAAKVKPAK